MILGEACSAIVLENKAKKSNDFYIKGSKNLFDNYSETSSNPNGEIIFQTMLKALESSNLTLQDLTFINAHSPGTQTSNEAELNALIKLQKLNAKKKLTVSSMKPFIGHSLGACCTNEIVLITSAIKDGFIPVTLGTKDIREIVFSQYKKIDSASTILFSYNGFSGNNLSLILSNKS
jgi:3-oxoacyl-[acyl-carrier-protein] synthase-1